MLCRFIQKVHLAVLVKYWDMVAWPKSPMQHSVLANKRRPSILPQVRARTSYRLSKAHTLTLPLKKPMRRLKRYLTTQSGHKLALIQKDIRISMIVPTHNQLSVLTKYCKLVLCYWPRMLSMETNKTFCTTHS